MAGSIIGKGGKIIQQLRKDSECQVRLPDSAGPERVLLLSGKLDSAGP